MASEITGFLYYTGMPRFFQYYFFSIFQFISEESSLTYPALYANFIRFYLFTNLIVHNLNMSPFCVLKSSFCVKTHF